MNTPLNTIHHVALQVDDIGEAVSWYTQNYACKVEYADETWAMLTFSNTALALVKPEQHPYHVAILTDDVSAYGSPTLHRDGTRSVYIKDCAGNHLEMLDTAEMAG